MKKLNFILFALTALVICSCSNKVDLYSDKGDSTIVYAMLDASADTNFVKITKSFIGDATTLAHDYNACNYDYKLDVNLIREKNNTVIPLDTVSRWIPYDENSTFYSGCYQTYYYTTANLKEGETYKLEIKRNDGVVVSSEAQTIDNFVYTNPVEDAKINFTTKSNYVRWINNSSDGQLKTNASMFEAVAYFRYSELQPGASEWVDKEIKWTLGSGKSDDLYDTHYAYYNVSFCPSDLFSLLGGDNYLKNNSPAGVQRKVKKIRFETTGIGSEFYNYLIINNSSSAIMDTPEYTNIDNGIGLMSSRVTKTRLVIPNQLTRQKIDEDFPTYGFTYEPNDPTD